jgi:murein DD-endopeptidase MepM/ murein hydrolase activator NlpD
MEIDKIQLLLILVAVLSILSCSRTGDINIDFKPATAAAAADSSSYNGNVLFGIPVDSYNVVNGTVKNNQLISSILESYGVSGDQIQKILDENKETFDPRKIKKGNNYTVFLRKDTLSRADYFIYEHDDFVKYVFSFRDSLKINRYNAEVRHEMRFSSGTINSSLWNAAIENGLNPNITGTLSEIYQWTIDFFGLQKGDKFKVVYDEQFIENKSVGISAIYAEVFEHAGTAIYAIPFMQGSTTSYYALNGTNLRKAFLKAPLKFSRISSRFTGARMHPILKIVRPHYGVDYAAPVGTPVHSIGDGRVIEASYENGAGRIIKVRHNSVYTTVYMHLSRFAPGIKAGSFVQQGETIGYVGTTGLSTGPHLDFRFYQNGSPVDPLKVDTPSADPVSPENQDKFEKVKAAALDLINTIE